MVYGFTLGPTVTSEDSGELIGAAYFWGVAHPPGYPLWTILSGIFLRGVPLGGIAWRCNLFSAVCSAGAVAVLARILTLVGLRPAAAATAALTCAFGRVLWSQSVITEVYSLHLLITVLIVRSGLQWSRTRSGKWLVLASLLLGLGMSNHQTIGYTGLAVAAWALLRRPRLLRDWRLVLASALAFAAGLLPHIYIYARANANPPVNWGHARTASAVWEHVSRHQYRVSAASEQKHQRPPWPARRAGQLRLMGEYCVREYGSVLFAGAVPGIFIMWQRRFRGFFLLWLLLVVSFVALHMLATDFSFNTRVDRWCNQVFHLPLYACIAISLGFSVEGVSALLERLAPGRSTLMIYGFTILVPAVPLFLNYGQNNMRHYYYADDHARNLLDCMLPNAIVFPSGDHNTFPLIYKVLIENYRADVIIADKYGYIDLELYRDMPDNPGKPRTLADRDRTEEWVIRNAKRPVYYTVNRSSLIPNARMVQTGILYHLLPEGRDVDGEDPWSRIHYRNLEGNNAPRDFGADNILADLDFFSGLKELNAGNLHKALNHFLQATEYARGVREIYNNIGSALAESGHDDDAIQYYRRAASMDSFYVPPRWNLARVYKRLQRFEDAEREFRELSRVDPKDFRIWGELGFLAARSNEGATAVTHWQESLKLKPDQPQIIEQLYWAYFGQAQSAPASSQSGDP